MRSSATPTHELGAVLSEIEAAASRGLPVAISQEAIQETVFSFQRTPGWHREPLHTWTALDRMRVGGVIDAEAQLALWKSFLKHGHIQKELQAYEYVRSRAAQSPEFAKFVDRLPAQSKGDYISSIAHVLGTGGETTRIGAVDAMFAAQLFPGVFQAGADEPRRYFAGCTDTTMPKWEGWVVENRTPGTGQVEIGDPIPLGFNVEDYSLFVLQCLCKQPGGGPAAVLEEPIRSQPKIVWTVLSGGGGFVAAAGLAPKRSFEGENVLYMPKPGVKHVEVKLRARVTRSSKDHGKPDARADNVDIAIRINSSQKVKRHWAGRTFAGEENGEPLSICADQDAILRELTDVDFRNHGKLITDTIGAFKKQLLFELDEKKREKTVGMWALQDVPTHFYSVKLSHRGIKAPDRETASGECTPGLSVIRPPKKVVIDVRVLAGEPISSRDVVILQARAAVGDAVVEYECKGQRVCSSTSGRWGPVSDVLRFEWSIPSRGRIKLNDRGETAILWVDEPFDDRPIKLAVRAISIVAGKEVLVAKRDVTVRVRSEVVDSEAAYVGFVDDINMTVAATDPIPCEAGQQYKTDPETTARESPLPRCIKFGPPDGWKARLSAFTYGRDRGFMKSVAPHHRRPRDRDVWYQWDIPRSQYVSTLNYRKDWTWAGTTHPWAFAAFGLRGSANPRPPMQAQSVALLARALLADKEFRHMGGCALRLLKRRGKFVALDIRFIGSWVGYTPNRLFGTSALLKLGVPVLNQRAIGGTFSIGVRNPDFGTTPAVRISPLHEDSLRVIFRDVFRAGNSGNILSILTTNRAMPWIQLECAVSIDAKTEKTQLRAGSVQKFPSVYTYVRKGNGPLRVVGKVVQSHVLQLIAQGEKCLWRGPLGL